VVFVRENSIFKAIFAQYFVGEKRHGLDNRDDRNGPESPF
jgi:hypothetical protein